MIKIIITVGLILRRLLCLLLLSSNGVALAVPATPTDEFIDHGNGTVTHKITGLMWKRCAEGQVWNGKTCTGTYATYTYDQALKITSTFGRHKNWRLPDITELSTIVAQEKSDPMINTTIFPEPPSTWFWTASVSADYPYGAWNISFFNGDRHYDVKSEHFAVRLVRGGQ
ncbi:MAG: DUF1566 domain-containing protein [Methylococcaceae bacterium]